MTPRPSRAGSAGLRSLRRLLRQEKSDDWAVRLLPRVVFGLAGAYTVFLLASVSMSSFVAVSAVLLLAAAGWLLRRRGQFLLALVSTTVTSAVTGYLAAVGAMARGEADGLLSGQAVFGYWALAGMALLGAWIPRDHPGRRGVTVLTADVVLVVTSAVGTVLPAASVPLGFLGVTLVLAVRGGGFTAVRSRLGRAERLGSRRPVPTSDTDR
ncbi:hypothetical protein [Streptomyces sp. NPDC054838]